MQDGIERGIERVCLRADRLTPRNQLPAQLADPLWFLSSKIVGLTEVASQVEEFDSAIFIMFDQLPIAVPHRAAGLATLVCIMRKVPEKCPPRQFTPAGKQRSETESVEAMGDSRY